MYNLLKSCVFLCAAAAVCSHFQQQQSSSYVSHLLLSVLVSPQFLPSTRLNMLWYQPVQQIEMQK